MYCNTLVCIAKKRAEIVLQEGQVYCNRGSPAAEETVLQYSLVGSKFVLQYKLYCELRVGLGRDTTRAGAENCDTAGAGGARRRQVRAGSRGPQAAGACRRQGPAGAGERGTRVAGRHWAGARQGRAAGERALQARGTGARHGRAAGPMGCALGALSLF